MKRGFSLLMTVSKCSSHNDIKGNKPASHRDSLDGTGYPSRHTIRIKGPAHENQGSNKGQIANHQNSTRSEEMTVIGHK